MNFSSLFLFFFGAIGAFNSFLVSFYFMLVKRPKQLSNLLFGLFLLFFSERAFRSLIYVYSNESTRNAYSMFDPVTFLFIGPFLLLYILSVINPTHKFLKNGKLYIVLWIICAVAMRLTFPFTRDPIFYKAYILKAINLQWLVHILISVWLVLRFSNTIQLQKDKLSYKIKWLYTLLAATLLLWLIFHFVSYAYFIIGSIVFSSIFYSFFLYFLFNKKIRTKVFDITGNSKNGIEGSKATIIIEKLDTYMQEQKPFKNSKLKLKDVADYLEIPSHKLSQLLNENLGKSFSEFINEQRIEEAKHIIQSNSKFTFDGIGLESGFSSKSSFYTVFKRIVGMTPSKYKEQYFSS